jgi:hypothetical protein
MNGDPISDSVHYERGYNKGKDNGFVEGLKRAFDLVGELGDFYESGMIVSDKLSDEQKKLHENSNRGRVNACRYAQLVIRKNSFGEEDLPW